MDIVNRVRSQADDFSAYTYSYDVLDRTTAVSNVGTPGSPVVVLTNQYDRRGRLREQSATIDGVADFKNSYDYNGRDNVTGITQDANGGNAVAYKHVDLGYDSSDQLTSMDRYVKSGTTQLLVASSGLTYSLNQRLETISHRAADLTLLAGYQWTYDQSGRVVSFYSANDGTVTYEYDQRSQLTDADYSTGYGIDDEHYDYDGNGNRTLVTRTDDTGTPTTEDFNTPAGSHNRIDTDGTHDYWFDDAGNRVRRIHNVNDTVTVYQYDVRNRLVKVIDYDSSLAADLEQNPTQTVVHQYDLNDRWIGKQVDTDGDEVADVTERYVYSNGQIIYRFVDDDGNDATEADELKNRYLWGQAVDQLLAQEDVQSLTSALPDDVLFALADNLNSVRDLARIDAGADGQLGTTDDQTVIERHVTYESFGLTVDVTNPYDSQAAPAETVFGYTGRIFEAFTGLQQNHFRWYDFPTGQWMSVDPAKADPNTYRYAGNDPTNNVDWNGLQEMPAGLKELNAVMSEILAPGYDPLDYQLPRPAQPARVSLPGDEFKPVFDVFIQKHGPQALSTLSPKSKELFRRAFDLEQLALKANGEDQNNLLRERAIHLEAAIRHDDRLYMIQGDQGTLESIMAQRAREFGNATTKEMQKAQLLIDFLNNPMLDIDAPDKSSSTAAAPYHLSARLLYGITGITAQEVGNGFGRVRNELERGAPNDGFVVDTETGFGHFTEYNPYLDPNYQQNQGFQRIALDPSTYLLMGRGSAGRGIVGLRGFGYLDDSTRLLSSTYLNETRGLVQLRSSFTRPWNVTASNSVANVADNFVVPQRAYQSGARMADSQLLRVRTNTRHTQNITEWRRTISRSDIGMERTKFLGTDAVKIDAGTWRSLDGTRQFRRVPNDYLGRHGIGQPSVPNTPHVHFEFLAPPNAGGSNLRVLKNVHVPLGN